MVRRDHTFDICSSSYLNV
uniref:Uncharacterized protein n=1 Tax=Arundo donax TaxID=35708 RepID=A0A0A9SLP0_ARUDO